MKTAINLLILVVLWCIASEMSYQDAVAAEVQRAVFVF